MGKTVLSNFRPENPPSNRHERGPLSTYLDKLMSGQPQRKVTRGAAMSEQERRLRAELAAGGQTIDAPTQRQALQGVLTMDPVEMATGMPLTGDEDYGALTQTALGGAADYMMPRYLQPGYEGPQTGSPVSDALVGLGQVFQGGSATGPMGAPSTVLSQYAGRLPAADRAFGTAGGVKVTGRGLGKGLGDLMADDAGAARPTLNSGMLAKLNRDFIEPKKVGDDEFAQHFAQLSAAPRQEVLDALAAISGVRPSASMTKTDALKEISTMRIRAARFDSALELIQKGSEAGAARPTLNEGRTLFQSKAFARDEPAPHRSPEEMATYAAHQQKFSQPLTGDAIATIALAGDASKAQARSLVMTMAKRDPVKHPPEAVAQALEIINGSDAAARAKGAPPVASEGRMLHQSKALKPK